MTCAYFFLNGLKLNDRLSIHGRFNVHVTRVTAQVWMHAMGGREGVIDTACKTSETGCSIHRCVGSFFLLFVVVFSFFKGVRKGLRMKMMTTIIHAYSSKLTSGHLEMVDVSTRYCFPVYQRVLYTVTFQSLVRVQQKKLQRPR